MRDRVLSRVSRNMASTSFSETEGGEKESVEAAWSWVGVVGFELPTEHGEKRKRKERELVSKIDLFLFLIFVLSQLPEPLLTFDLYQEFITFARVSFHLFLHYFSYYTTLTLHCLSLYRRHHTFFLVSLTLYRRRRLRWLGDSSRDSRASYRGYPIKTTSLWHDYSSI